MSLDSVQTRQQIQRAALRAARLEGALQSALERKKVLTHEVALAKGRLSLAEEVSAIFEALQNRAHERSLGALERLLSAFVADVLPEEGVVRLLAQIKANATWLDIALEKASGNLEDVLDANGGALTNVVSAGLRYAALSRTKNRRLMILDEPDCWLKPDRVPAFISVISQVASQTKTQTFFITHHEPDLLEGRVNVVRLGLTPTGKVYAKAEAGLVTDWEDDQEPGIRSIELINVRRHEHTVIPCYPGATAFIGDNNLGKSTAITSSFKAVAYGESDDSMIRHGAQEAKIIIRLEDNQRIEWVRSSKKSPSVMYRHYKADTLLAEGRPKARNQAPDWVTDVLGVARVDDLDIQVGAQKSPVFLLNDSAPKRAQILSVGKESGHLKSLMRKYDESRSSDRDVVKYGELELAKLNQQALYLEKAPALAMQVDVLQKTAESLLDELAAREKLSALTARVQQRTLAAEQLTAQLSALEDLPRVPELQPLDALERQTQRIGSLSHVLTVPIPPALPVLPVIEPTTDVLRLGARMAQAQKALQASSLLPNAPELPELLDLAALEKTTQRLPAAKANADAVEKDLGALTQQFSADAKALAAFQEKLGACPLCGSAFEGANHDH